MSTRRDDILDAAITVIGEQGIRAATHRAVDVTAGLPMGSTSNYFRTKDALLGAVAERFAARERANWDEIAATVSPRTAEELAQSLAEFVLDSTTRNRTLTLARYAILVEGAIRPQLQPVLAASGARVGLWFKNWLNLIGSTDPERDVYIVAQNVSGLVLHQLSYPDPAFDPLKTLTALLKALVREGDREERHHERTRGVAGDRRATPTYG